MERWRRKEYRWRARTVAHSEGSHNWTMGKRPSLQRSGVMASESEGESKSKLS